MLRTLLCSFVGLAVSFPLQSIPEADSWSSWNTGELNLPTADKTCQSGFSVALPNAYNFSAELPAFPLEIPKTISLDEILKTQYGAQAQIQGAAAFQFPTHFGIPQAPQNDAPKEGEQSAPAQPQPQGFYPQLYSNYPGQPQPQSQYPYYAGAPQAAYPAHFLPQQPQYNPYYGQQQQAVYPSPYAFQQPQPQVYQQAHAYPQPQPQYIHASPYAGLYGGLPQQPQPQAQAQTQAQAQAQAGTDNRRGGRRLRDDPLLEDDDLEQILVEELIEEGAEEQLAEVGAEVAETIVEEIVEEAKVEEVKPAVPNYFSVENTQWAESFPGATPEGRLCVPAAEARIISRSSGEHFVSQFPYGFQSQSLSGFQWGLPDWAKPQQAEKKAEAA